MPRQKYSFEPGKIYHLSNIGNTVEAIFISNDNYNYFLRKLMLSCSGIFEIIAYSLLPNQYQLLVKMKTNDKLRLIYSLKKKVPVLMVKLNSREMSQFLSQEIGNFLNAYAKAFNRCHGRKGSLFRENFRKCPIDYRKLSQTVKVLCYIPVIQGYANTIHDWEYCFINQNIDRVGSIVNWKKYRHYYKFGDHETDKEEIINLIHSEKILIN